MARNDPQMNLRVPMELKEKIEKAALDNGRTITAEAVYRLEQSFMQDSTFKIGSPEFREKAQKSFELTAKIFEAIENGTIEIKHKK